MIMAVDTPTYDPQTRERFGRVLGEFWFNGAGPTHGDVAAVFDLFDIEADAGSKRSRIGEAIRQVSDDQLFGFVGALVELLDEQGYLTEESQGDRTRINLEWALTKVGWGLSGGSLVGESGIGVSPRQLPDLPAAREHIARIERAIRDADDPQLIGSAKELLESVSKMVLESQDREVPQKFPALLSEALKLLKLHPKSPPTESELLVEPVRRILSSVQQIALATNELRRDYGTGHGRSGETARLDPRHARLTAGAAVVVATLMLDTFEDPQAPWQNLSTIVGHQS